MPASRKETGGGGKQEFKASLLLLLPKKEWGKEIREQVHSGGTTTSPFPGETEIAWQA